MSRRNRARLQPIGTDKLLQLAMPPAWHHYRKQFDWIAEINWGSDAGADPGWSWLLKDRRTGLYLELGIDARAIRTVPQAKVAAAVAAMQQQHETQIEALTAADAAAVRAKTALIT